MGLSGGENFPLHSFALSILVTCHITGNGTKSKQKNSRLQVIAERVTLVFHFNK